MHVLSRLELHDEWLEGAVSYADELPLPNREFLGSSLRDEQSFLHKIEVWRHGLESAVIRNGGGYILVHDELPLDRYVTLLTEFHASSAGR
jgi:hypothetical protein